MPCCIFAEGQDCLLVLGIWKPGMLIHCSYLAKEPSTMHSIKPLIHRLHSGVVRVAEWAPQLVACCKEGRRSWGQCSHGMHAPRWVGGWAGGWAGFGVSLGPYCGRMQAPYHCQEGRSW